MFRNGAPDVTQSIGWKRGSKREEESKGCRVFSYKCIDCGKESTKRRSRGNFNKAENEYRCQKCAIKLRDSKKIITKVMYKCVDCGKERTFFPSTFYKQPEDYRCKECANKYRRGKKNSKMILTCVDCGEKSTERHPSNFCQIPENYRCVKCANKFRLQNSQWLASVTAANKRKPNDPVWRKNCKSAMEKLSRDPKWKQSIDAAAKKRSKNPLWFENNLISTTGQGFWYGHPIINKEKPKSYCELWKQELWYRIDAAWDFKSSISGKTKEDNKNKCLDRHHVYWQEKACCEWDEDANGYYANINLGTRAKPNIIKYYIKGDPNKFVLLTHDEHTTIQGRRIFGKDKIYWIKFFEELVEQREKEGKKCYLSKEEYRDLKFEGKINLDYYNERQKIFISRSM